MPKVLISDKMSDRAREIFEQRGIEVDVKTGLSADELKEIIGNYDGLAIRSATKVKQDVLEATDTLQVIGRAGIGVDNIEVQAATQRGVVVMNTPFGNSITTAEHAISLIMAMARQIPQAVESTLAGRWEKSKFMGIEVMNKTLGIIGCGNIGAVVADRAQGLKMRVIAFDPYLSPEKAEQLGIEKVSLDDLFGRADFISMHTPLTENTKNIINADSIAKMKKGVRIVNCARGGLVDEAALKEGLESGQVGAAALDVFAEEPAQENPLFNTPNFIGTPHLGASTTEAQENVAIQVAEQMADFLLTGAVTNAINMPSLTAEEAPRLKPYMRLAEQVGSFGGQITESGLESVTIEFQGDVAQVNTRPLQATVLQGLLTPLLDSVNMVNAPVLAKERDIHVKEIKSDEAGAFHTLIRLTIASEDQTRSVAGTLFSGEPRITEINGIPIEADLGENMLFVRNQDKPGFIGKLGDTLGENDLNIATFHLGRATPGGAAVCLVQVDQPVTGKVLDSVRALPQVVQARALRF